MEIVIIAVVITLIFDWGLGTLVGKQRKAKEKAEEHALMLDIKYILRDENTSTSEKQEKIKEVCRMTNLKMAAAIYIFLDDYQELVKD